MQCPYCNFIYKLLQDILPNSFNDVCPRCKKEYRAIRIEKNIFKGEKINE